MGLFNCTACYTLSVKSYFLKDQPSLSTLICTTPTSHGSPPSDVAQYKYAKSPWDKNKILLCNTACHMDCRLLPLTVSTSGDCKWPLCTANGHYALPPPRTHAYPWPRHRLKPIPFQTQTIRGDTSKTTILLLAKSSKSCLANFDFFH